MRNGEQGTGEGSPGDTRQITALTAQKRNRQRVNVYLDGEFAFGLSRIVAAWLHVGQDLTSEKIASLQSDDSREVAFQQALKFLNYRARSENEVRKNLVSHGFSEEIIAGVLLRLGQSGLLNDLQFAQGWVDNRSTFRPRSKRALAVELRQRGIQDEAIEQAVEGVDDEQLAYEAASSQARRLENLDWPDFRLKLSGKLARRGFRYEDAAQAVKRVWDELHAEEPPDDEAEDLS